MYQREENGLGLGDTMRAACRLAGFLGFTVGMIPVYYVLRGFFKRQPFFLTTFFHRNIMRMLGFQIHVRGTPVADKPTLFVANHSSYLDIPVLGSILPAAFVAKADVADWPFFGYMAKLQKTVFIERKVMRTGDQADAMRDRLAQRQSLILFPEGTSSDGQAVLPFKTSFFAVAESAAKEIDLVVQPVSVACTAFDGLPITRCVRPHYAWYGDMTLVGHLWNVLKINHIRVDVMFHQAVSPHDYPNRKALAAYCQQQVSRGIEGYVTGRLPQEPLRTMLPAPDKAII